MAKARFYSVKTNSGWPHYCSTHAASSVESGAAQLVIKPARRQWRRRLRQLGFYAALFGVFLLGLVVGRVLP
jgi:hypothetical protein